jgi:hypothetical protein
LDGGGAIITLFGEKAGSRSNDVQFLFQNVLTRVMDLCAVEETLYQIRLKMVCLFSGA